MSFARVERALLIPIERIAPMKDNPRQSFRHLEDLAESIADRGIMQPLVVRRDPEKPGFYMTVAGARRLMAANILRGHEAEDVRARVAVLPCIVCDETDGQALASALAENLARDDLTRAEAMAAVLRLEREYNWSGREIARRTGRTQTDIAELLKVAKDEDLAALVNEDLLSPTAAGVMVRLPEEVRREAVAQVRAGQLRTTEDVRSLNPRRSRRSGMRPSPVRPLDDEGVKDIFQPEGTAPDSALANRAPSHAPTPSTGVGSAACVPQDRLPGVKDIFHPSSPGAPHTGRTPAAGHGGAARGTAPNAAVDEEPAGPAPLLLVAPVRALEQAEALLQTLRRQPALVQQPEIRRALDAIVALLPPDIPPA